MPYEPDSPETKEVCCHLLAEKTLDIYHIEEFHVSVDANNPAAAKLGVKWSLGYVEHDEYHPAEHFGGLFDGSLVTTAMGTQVTEGRSRYDEIKFAIWGVLADAGEVPEGTAS